MLIRVKGFFSASLVFGLIFSVPILSSAHHSVFPYDMVTFLELEGLITEVRWRSPHIRLKIAAESDSGETVEWELEGDSINVYFVAPAGGTTLHIDRQLVRVVSPDSPLGKALVGTAIDDEFQFRSPSGMQELCVLEVG